MTDRQRRYYFWLVINDDPGEYEDEHGFCLYGGGCVYGQGYLPEAVQCLLISCPHAQI